MKSTALMIVAGLMLGEVAQAQESRGEELKRAPAPIQINQPITMVPAQTPPAPPISKPATWSSQEIGAIGKMIEGSWRTLSPVGQGDDKLKSADVFVSAAHVHIDGLPDTLYVEAARVDAAWAPFRQAIWQIYMKKGKPHLRTFEFRQPKGAHPFLISMWATPDLFPAALDAKEMYGTMDLELSVSAGKLTGKTPYPYPTGRDGAVEMTSEFTISGDTMSTADRGFAADGKVVWGSEAGQKYEFKRFTPDVEVRHYDSGLIKISYKTQSTGEAAKPDWRVGIHYTGSLVDGYVFDTTRTTGRFFTFRAGQELIKGFTEGTQDVRQGDHFKLIIPSDLAYGPIGRARSKIPADAWLSYEIEVLAVEAPTPPAEHKPGDGHDHGSDAKPGAAPILVNPGSDKLQPIPPSSPK